MKSRAANRRHFVHEARCHLGSGSGYARILAYSRPISPDPILAALRPIFSKWTRYCSANGERGFLDDAAAREIARRAPAKRRECPRRVRATGRVGRRVEYR